MRVSHGVSVLMGILIGAGTFFYMGTAQKSAADYRDEVMAADRAFSALSDKEGTDVAFLTFLTKDAVALNGGRQPVIGNDVISAGFSNKASGNKLLWEPEDGMASETVGYTWGRSISTFTNDDGEFVTRHGKYITIWARQDDGSWKVITDGGNGNPPPPQE